MSLGVQGGTAAAAPSVSLRGVTKRFGDFAAVHEMDLDIPRGHFFTMLGPSGCGKTTTLRMIGGVEEALERHSVPWTVGDRDVEEYLHLYLLNRGVLITPFHNMALMCPATTLAQVDRHTEAFGEALEELWQ